MAPPAGPRLGFLRKLQSVDIRGFVLVPDETFRRIVQEEKASVLSNNLKTHRQAGALMPTICGDVKDNAVP